MLNIIKNQSLSFFTTFKIGGPADFFVRVETREELYEAVNYARLHRLPFFILGGGSNVLFSDKGFRGLVIKNEMNNIQFMGTIGQVKKETNLNRQKVYLKVDSGVLVNRLVRYMLDQSLKGLENFLGQPGSVGGAIYINAHNMKKGDFFGSHVIKGEIINLKGDFKTVEASYFKFGYDLSHLQEVKETLVWTMIEAEKVSQEEMVKVWERANEAVKSRQETQPYGIPSAGCAFRNISEEQFAKIKSVTHTKSAGFLIDSCQLKGMKVGQAMISEKHANFIVNLGGAKATDVLKLLNLAKSKVKKKYGVELHEEIVKVGDF